MGFSWQIFLNISGEFDLDWVVFFAVQLFWRETGIFISSIKAREFFFVAVTMQISFFPWCKLTKKHWSIDYKMVMSDRMVSLSETGIHFKNPQHFPLHFPDFLIINDITPLNKHSLSPTQVKLCIWLVTLATCVRQSFLPKQWLNIWPDHTWAATKWQTGRTCFLLQSKFSAWILFFPLLFEHVFVWLWLSVTEG